MLKRDSKIRAIQISNGIENPSAIASAPRIPRNTKVSPTIVVTAGPMSDQKLFANLARGFSTIVGRARRILGRCKESTLYCTEMQLSTAGTRRDTLAS